MNEEFQTRRFFIKGLGAFAAVPLFGCAGARAAGEKPLVRFGLVTDCHYADIPYARRPWPVGDASYRESAAKLDECVAVMNREHPDFLVELGDFKDLGPDKTSTAGYLEKIENVFAGFRGELLEAEFACTLAEDAVVTLDFRGVRLQYSRPRGTLSRPPGAVP